MWSARAAAITTLPPDLLALIIGLAGRESCPSVTLVCKAWRQLVYEQPQLWSVLRLHLPNGSGMPAPSLASHAAWLAGKLALLQRVGRMVASLELEGSACEDAPPELLACLEPAALTELRVSQPAKLTPWAARQLSRFTCLRSLDLHLRGSRPLPLAASTALASATCLQRLKLAAPCLQPPLLHGLPDCCPQLTRLDLLASDQPLPPLHPLTALTVLRDLSAFERASVEGGMRLLPLSAFSAIQRLAFRSTTFQVVGGLTTRVCPELGCSMIQLRLVPGHGGGLALACAGLEFDDKMPLAALLTTLGVGGTTLARLYLDECRLAPGAIPLPQPPASNSLAGVERLILDLLLPAPGLGDGGDGAEEAAAGGGDGEVSSAALQQLLLNLPELKVLNLLHTLLPEGLPACLVQCTRLTALQLSRCGLTNVPEGPFLSRLALLALNGNSLSALPPALSSATQLQSLILSGNPDLRLEGTELEAGGPLCHLAALSRLELPASALPEPVAVAVQRLRQRLPGLRLELA